MCQIRHPVCFGGEHANVPCAQLAVRARDPFWHEVLYGTLIDLGAVRALLDLDGNAPGLEAYLRSQGGLTGAVPGVPAGPLSSRQACSLPLVAVVQAVIRSRWRICAVSPLCSALSKLRVLHLVSLAM